MKKNAKEIRFILLHGLLVVVLLALLVITACFKDEVIVVPGDQVGAAGQLLDERE